MQYSALPSSVGTQGGNKTEATSDKSSRQLEAMKHKQLLGKVITTQGIEVPPELKEVMQDSPGRELNQERKRQNHIKSLEQQLTKEMDAFESWKVKYKQIYKAEAKRRVERVEQLQQRLYRAKTKESKKQERTDEEMEENKTSEDEELFSQERYVTEQRREAERKHQQVQNVKIRSFEEQNMQLQAQQRELVAQVQQAMQQQHAAAEQSRWELHRQRSPKRPVAPASTQEVRAGASGSAASQGDDEQDGKAVANQQGTEAGTARESGCAKA